MASNQFSDKPVVQYDPVVRIHGFKYYQISDIMVALAKSCEFEEVQDLVEQALTYQPEGLELRNEYLLKIRVELQTWRSSGTASTMVKYLISRLLDDTVSGDNNKLPAERLRMNTAVAYDPRKVVDFAVKTYGS